MRSLLGGVIVCAFALATARAETNEPLVGLWVSENTWDGGPSGDLTLSRGQESNGQAHWHASLAGLKTDFAGAGTSLRFEFPGQRGTFRGTQDGDSIRGFWVQPHVAGDPRDPDGEGMTYASPLTLTKGTDGAWHGAVVPARTTFTLYLRVFRDGAGALTAAFRNPEMNFRGGAPQFHVTQSGSTVSFAAPNKTLSATFDERVAMLKIRFPGLDKTFELMRAGSVQAGGFFPRTPGERYTYRVPDSAGDGWQVARAGDMGIDEGKLAAVVQSLADVDPAAMRPDLVHALLVARHGKLVLDEYFAGYDRKKQHDLRSAGKTYSSVLLGSLMRSGAAISPDTRIYPLVAAMGPFALPEPRKDAITLAELMTHTSGLACDDNDDSSPGNEETMQSQRRERNWWKYTLDLPVAHDPGTRYAYCSAGTNLMGAALTTAAHLSLLELVDRDIAQPLQWGPYYWNVMPNGEGYLGGGALVRPRDFLKLGQAYLDGGVWNGKRLVDGSWVERSTKPSVAISPATTGLSPEQFSNYYIPGQDGFAWHVATLHAPAHDYRAYGASGNGGQLLVIVPELDLAVVFTGGNYGQGLIWNAWRDKLLPTEIIPAIDAAR